MDLISSICRDKVHAQQIITVIPQMLHFSLSANIDTLILKVEPRSAPVPTGRKSVLAFVLFPRAFYTPSAGHEQSHVFLLQVCSTDAQADSDLRTLIHQNQPENVGCFSYLGSKVTRDAKCTREIKCRISLANSAFNNMKTLFYT